MSYSRCFSWLALSFCVFAASEVSAQSRVGEQWLAAGMTLSPGFVHHQRYGSTDRTTTIGGLRARLGLHHLVTSRLVMAAEVELGQGWYNRHRAAPDGYADSDHHFAWQAGVMGRFLFRDDGTGPVVGTGLHIYRAALEEAPVQSLAFDVRPGWYLWKGDEFVLFELGYAIPFLEGLALPTDFSGQPNPDLVEKAWTLHRFAIGLSYGF